MEGALVLVPPGQLDPFSPPLGLHEPSPGEGTLLETFVQNAQERQENFVLPVTRPFSSQFLQTAGLGSGPLTVLRRPSPHPPRVLGDLADGNFPRAGSFTGSQGRRGEEVRQLSRYLALALLWDLACLP